MIEAHTGRVAFLPLILVTRRKDVMVAMVNRAFTNGAITVIAAVITCLSVYLLYSTLARL